MAMWKRCVELNVIVALITYTDSQAHDNRD